MLSKPIAETVLQYNDIGVITHQYAKYDDNNPRHLYVAQLPIRRFMKTALIKYQHILLRRLTHVKFFNAFVYALSLYKHSRINCMANIASECYTRRQPKCGSHIISIYRDAIRAREIDMVGESPSLKSFVKSILSIILTNGTVSDLKYYVKIMGIDVSTSIAKCGDKLIIPDPEMVNYLYIHKYITTPIFDEDRINNYIGYGRFTILEAAVDADANPELIDREMLYRMIIKLVQVTSSKQIPLLKKIISKYNVTRDDYGLWTGTSTDDHIWQIAVSSLRESPQEVMEYLFDLFDITQADLIFHYGIILCMVRRRSIECLHLIHRKYNLIEILSKLGYDNEHILDAVSMDVDPNDVCLQMLGALVVDYLIDMDIRLFPLADDDRAADPNAMLMDIVGYIGKYNADIYARYLNKVKSDIDKFYSGEYVITEHDTDDVDRFDEGGKIVND